MTPSERNFGLDIVRATAIMLVLVAHTGIVGGGIGVVCGVIGVELFFILSGFLIGRIMLRLFSSKDCTFEDVMIFLKRRWYRTLPVYYLFILINAFIASQFLDEGVSQYISYLFFLQNFAWDYTAYTDANGAHHYAFASETWSLTIEEWFYFLVAMLSFFAFRVLGIKNAVMWVAVLCTAFCLVTKTIAVLYYDAQLLMEVRRIDIMRFDTLMIGVLLSFFYDKSHDFLNRNRKIFYLSGYTGVLFCSIFILFFGGNDAAIPSVIKILFYPILSLCIAAMFPYVCNIRTKKVSSKTISIITWMSIHAYIIYLSHRIVIKALASIGLPPAANIITLILFGVGQYIVASIVHKYYEKPIMDLRPKEQHRG